MPACLGDLATMFMLEDRVSARTNAGGDSNEFDPATAPDSTDMATALVGNVSVANWANNATIENGMKAIRVPFLVFSCKPNRKLM